MSIIELGDRTAVPVHKGTRIRFSALPVAAVLAAVTLLILGGSAAPPPEMRLAFTTEQRIDAYALTPDGLFTTEAGSTGFESAVIRRFDLARPDPVWSVDVPALTPYLTSSEVADVLLLQSMNGSLNLALDATTGRELWRREEQLVRRLVGDAVLTYDDLGLQLTDVRTGAARWTFDLDGVAQIDPGDPRSVSADYVVVVDETGKVTVLSSADGTVLGAADFDAAPAVVADEQSGDTAEYATAGGRLYVFREEEAGFTLSAYDMPGLKRRWETSTPVVQLPSACGRYVCLTTNENLTVLDAETGAEAWSAADWSRGIDTLALDIPGPSRIAVDGGELTPTWALADPATGRILTDLGENGYLVGPTLMQNEAGSPDSTWIRIPADDGTLRTVGRIGAAVPQRCRSATAVLVCPTSDGRLTVWRLPDR